MGGVNADAAAADACVLVMFGEPVVVVDAKVVMEVGGVLVVEVDACCCSQALILFKSSQSFA